ncbi:hypothetical protein HPP92_003204 [Vanilla planifolia]|uniref:Uncharacterized protein n=1 Tax=Vanilla planifolia TaxID=51239 RepID=A0A835S6Z8_VANPL|nr:hypothetical protein HPP92_003204 [Vanilla planifolia]
MERCMAVALASEKSEDCCSLSINQRKRVAALQRSRNFVKQEEALLVEQVSLQLREVGASTGRGVEESSGEIRKTF